MPTKQQSECEKAYQAFQLSTRTLYSRTVDIERQAFEAGWQAYQSHLRELAQSVPPIEVSQEAIAAAERMRLGERLLKVRINYAIERTKQLADNRMEKCVQDGLQIQMQTEYAALKAVLDGTHYFFREKAFLDQLEAQDGK